MTFLRLAFIITILASLAPFANAQDGSSSAARRDYWWCRADDQKEAIRYLPGKAIAAPTQRHAAVLFDSALLSQYSSSSTQRTECGVTSLLGYHDWVTSNLTRDAKAAGWKLAFVEVASNNNSSSSGTQISGPDSSHRPVAGNANTNRNASSNGKCLAHVISVNKRQNPEGVTEYAYGFRFHDGREIGINYLKDPRPILEWSGDGVLLPCLPN